MPPSTRRRHDGRKHSATPHGFAQVIAAMPSYRRRAGGLPVTRRLRTARTTGGVVDALHSAPSERHAVLIVDSMVGSYWALIEQGKTLPDRGRVLGSWRDVLAPLLRVDYRRRSKSCYPWMSSRSSAQPLEQFSPETIRLEVRAGLFARNCHCRTSPRSSFATCNAGVVAVDRTRRSLGPAQRRAAEGNGAPSTPPRHVRSLEPRCREEVPRWHVTRTVQRPLFR